MMESINCSLLINRCVCSTKNIRGIQKPQRSDGSNVKVSVDDRRIIDFISLDHVLCDANHLMWETVQQDVTSKDITMQQHVKMCGLKQVDKITQLWKLTT